MPRISSRSCVFASLAAMAAFGSSAMAGQVQLNATGTMLFDSPGSDLNGDPIPGVTPLLFFDSNNSEVIQSIQGVTLNGISHTYVGDLTVALRFQPANIALPFTDAILFSRINDGTVDDDDFVVTEGNNLDGTYGFSDSANLTIQTAAGPADDDADIAEGTYRPSDFYAEGDPAAFVNLTNTFAGLNLADGTFILVIADYGPGDTGTIGSATLDLTTVAVPEPTSIAALGLIGGLMVRRRN